MFFEDPDTTFFCADLHSSKNELFKSLPIFKQNDIKSMMEWNALNEVIQFLLSSSYDELHLLQDRFYNKTETKRKLEKGEIIEDYLYIQKKWNNLFINQTVLKLIQRADAKVSGQVDTIDSVENSPQKFLN